MDVARTPVPSSWSMLLEQIEYVRIHPEICKTLVVDTIDWAEQMCIEHVCAKHQKQGIEDFGYGNGYVYVKEEFGRFLNRLSEVIETKVNIVLTAHAQMRKFEQPDEMGAYDRWELKLGKKTTSQISPLVKEWADMVLFANYKTYSVAVDDKGKKRKAQGGSRVMYTTHHPCWDAKNRYGLPEELPFHYTSIAPMIEQKQISQVSTVNTESTKEKQIPLQKEDAMVQPPEKQEDRITQATDSSLEESSIQESSRQEDTAFGIWESNPNHLPQALKDLMRNNQVTEWDIQNVVAARGYYPADTPIERYEEGFIQGVLIGAWSQVYGMIQKMKETMEIPFN